MKMKEEKKTKMQLKTYDKIRNGECYTSWSRAFCGQQVDRGIH